MARLDGAETDATTDAGDQRFLHDLERRCGRCTKSRCCESGRRSRINMRPTTLSHGVVPSDVFRHRRESAVSRKRPAACKPPVSSKTAWALRRVSGSEAHDRSLDRALDAKRLDVVLQRVDRQATAQAA